VNLESGSIDYVFTDPPFGANISYSELNFLQESWLRVTTDNKKEAIVNASHGKALFDYQTLMTESLKEYYRVLKPGGWLTMEFSNTSAAVWNSIQNALQGVGFVVANVAALDKQQGSFKAVTTPTAVKQDLIITCYKPTNTLLEKFELSHDTNDNVWDFVDDLLLHLPVHIQRNTSTTAIIERSPKILYDRLIAYYVQHNYPVPMNASEFQAGLREHFVERDGMFFTVDQVIEYEDKKSQTPDFQPLSLFIGSEADGIQWLKTHLSEGEKTYAEILPHWMQDMVATKKGDEVPELMKILEENFIKNENGAWRNPDPEKEADLEIARTKKLLSQFTAYVEMASRPQGRIREARLEALRAGFKDCYKKRDFATIMMVGNKIPESLLTEDDVLLQYYDIASMHV
jgi:DNA modification methylase